MADSLSSYDDDLPDPTPATAPRRDAATGQFKSPQAPDPAPVAPPAPQHSAYALSKARQFGIAGAESMAPAELDRFLAFAEQRQAQQPQQAPAPEPEEPVDWGKDAEGKPLTETDYGPAVAKAIRAAHALPKLQKANADLQAKIDRQEQERGARQATRQLNKVLAERPDLFGEKPGEAEAGSPEAERYQLVIDRLNRLVATKSHTTLEADAKAAVALFGPSPEPKPQVRNSAHLKKAPSLTDYQNGELAAPTARRGTETLTRRQQMIEAEVAARRENGTYVHSSPDDDDDLPE